MPRFRDLSEQNKRSMGVSLALLVSANVLPLLAVWFQGWGAPELTLLYSIEVGFVLAFGLLRLAMVTRQGAGLGFHSLKLFYLPFFLLHFGGFFMLCLVTSIKLFGDPRIAASDQIFALIRTPGSWLASALLISHAFSFFWVFLREKGYSHTTISRRMLIPYLRTVPFMLLVLGSAFAIQKWCPQDYPAFASLGLVIIKTVTDAITHFRSHLLSLRPATVSQ
ncbi:MAG: DUF6498-containing protein [Verrucomicrobiota bacterium]